VDDRLEALRKLLSQGLLSTQEELREKLRTMRFDVTQSTVSRDLRRVGAIKAIDPEGRTVYKLPELVDAPVAPAASLRELVLDISSNGTLIVIRTTPGSASLVARRLDQARPQGILGTIAGDDTIFVAPAAPRASHGLIEAIEKRLEG
jgi:transcriptional regulator of arginine metabolism